MPEVTEQPLARRAATKGKKNYQDDSKDIASEASIEEDSGSTFYFSILCMISFYQI